MTEEVGVYVGGDVTTPGSLHSPALCGALENAFEVGVRTQDERSGFFSSPLFRSTFD